MHSFIQCKPNSPKQSVVCRVLMCSDRATHCPCCDLYAEISFSHHFAKYASVYNNMHEIRQQYKLSVQIWLSVSVNKLKIIVLLIITLSLINNIEFYSSQQQVYKLVCLIQTKLA